MFNLKFVQRFLYLNWPPVYELENTWHAFQNLHKSHQVLDNYITNI